MLGDTQFKFGKYKGKPIKDVPDDYLRFLLSKDILKGKLLKYCQDKFNLLKKTYILVVQDSLNADGEYTIQAYNKKEAMEKCIKDNNIRLSQSGTIIYVK